MYKISGNKVKTSLELAMLEIGLLSNQILDGLELEIAKKIKLMGMTQKAAVSELTGWIKTDTELYKTFQNTLSRTINTIQSNLVATPKLDKLARDPANTKYYWVKGIAKHCPDCQRMARLGVQTKKQWRAYGVGLPQEGLTVCGYYCKCNLIEVTSE
ncbi:MAG: hypothetical protein K8R79_07330 [Calditrichales bacterium]|nr:hypothetical protein [Calditrichales bacterium]